MTKIDNYLSRIADALERANTQTTEWTAHQAETAAIRERQRDEELAEAREENRKLIARLDAALEQHAQIEKRLRALSRPVCWVRGHVWGGWHPLPWLNGRTFGNWRACERCWQQSERRFQ